MNTRYYIDPEYLAYNNVMTYDEAIKYEMDNPEVGTREEAEQAVADYLCEVDENDIFPQCEEHWEDVDRIKVKVYPVGDLMSPEYLLTYYLAGDKVVRGDVSLKGEGCSSPYWRKREVRAKVFAVADKFARAILKEEWFVYDIPTQTRK